MQFILSESWDEAIGAVANRLKNELAAGNRVLWLISGGSQLPANAQIMGQLPTNLTGQLSVMPIDERYGPSGHADSNWNQLMQQGFDGGQAKLIPALKDGLDFNQNIDYYNQLIEQAFADNDVLIGQLGIGHDGHTSGILPHSPACQETNRLVTGYEAPPLKRLTTTFKALQKLDAAYVLAFGEGKRETLISLKDKSLPLEEQPAQVLKTLREAYIYNDQVGEN